MWSRFLAILALCTTLIVGYVLGARIVQAYYDNSEDKAKAVQATLGVTDYTAFLEKSGYAERFEP